MPPFQQKTLMCAPTYYDVKYAINPHMPPNINNVNKHLAKKQWQTLYKVLSNYNHIELIDGHFDLPDMVFTANGGLWLAEQHTFVVSNFATPQRSPESEFFADWILKNISNVRVYQFPKNVSFEGAGDCLKDKQGRYWIGQGSRTSEKARQHLESLGVCVYSIELVMPEYYHLDTCFAPLPNGKFLVYLPAISSNSLNVLSSVVGSENIIPVDKQSAEAFSCNVVVVNDCTLVMNAGISSALINTLQKLGFVIITIDLSEFMKAGGAAKCLTLDITRQ